MFWEKVLKSTDSLDVNEAQLPRKHKTARRYDNGESSGDFANSPKSYYCQVYYEATDCNLIALTWLMHIPTLSTVSIHSTMYYNIPLTCDHVLFYNAAGFYLNKYSFMLNITYNN